MEIFALTDGRDELFQWDTNRRIYAEGAQEVHFVQSFVQMDVEVENGTAPIPDEMLQTAVPIKVYAYVTEDGNFTLRETILEIIPRVKPDGYIFTPTETLNYEHLLELIGDLDDLSTEDKENLVAAINEIFAGRIQSHNDLDGRDAADAHPMSAITGLTAAFLTKYQKPADGIPKNDLSSTVKSSLDKADSALQTADLTPYRTANEQDAIDAGKQDTISDLETIRAGAALGSTALQAVPSTYRTSAAQDAIDATKQTKITASGVLQGDGAGNVTAKTVDSEVTEDSTNLVTSGAVYDAVAAKQDRLTAGTNITIEGNVISASGGGGGGVPLDPQSSVDFAIGYDEGGLYIVTEEEDENNG